MVKFYRKINEDEKRNGYLNLIDDEGKHYGNLFPEVGTPLLIITEGKKYEAIRSSYDCISGLFQWHTNEDVREGDLVSIRYEHTWAPQEGRIPICVVIEKRQEKELAEAEVENSKTENPSEYNNKTNDNTPENEVSNDLPQILDDDLPHLPDYDKNVLSTMTGDGKQEWESPLLNTCTIEEIKRILTEKNNIVGNVSFGELKFELPRSDNFIVHLTVAYQGIGNRNIIVKSTFDFCEKAITDLLLLSADSSYVGRLCIEKHNDKHVFSIKKNIELVRYSTEEVVSIIENVIRQSFQAGEVIKRYL
jgi:hypothetical protein